MFLVGSRTLSFWQHQRRSEGFNMLAIFRGQSLPILQRSTSQRVCTHTWTHKRRPSSNTKLVRGQSMRRYLRSGLVTTLYADSLSSETINSSALRDSPLSRDEAWCNEFCHDTGGHPSTISRDRYVMSLNTRQKTQLISPRQHPDVDRAIVISYIKCLQVTRD